MRGRRHVLCAAAVCGGVLGSGSLALAAFTDSTGRSASFEAQTWFTPVLSSVPDVLGSAREGSILTVGAPSFLRYPANVPDTYTWQRCDAAALSCTNVGAAATYTPVTLDVGSHLRVVVSSRRGTGTPLVSTSNLTTVVQDTGTLNNRPSNTATPTISGTTTIGSTLTAAAGTWTGVSDGYDYQWLRCDNLGRTPCTPVGANATTYLLTPADAGARMRVQVTGKVFLSSVTAVATTADTSIVN